MTMTGKEAREMFRRFEREHRRRENIKTAAMMIAIMVVGVGAIFAAGVVIGGF